MNAIPDEFWSIEPQELLRQLPAEPTGLTSEDARQRLSQFGANLLRPKKRLYAIALITAQF